LRAPRLDLDNRRLIGHHTGAVVAEKIAKTAGVDMTAVDRRQELNGRVFMDETEVTKTCHKCGADVTHSRRHKNVAGAYVCSACLDAKKEQKARGRSREELLAKTRRIFLYAILVAAASWIFFKLIDTVSQLSEE
jgi:hypothetical protein